MKDAMKWMALCEQASRKQDPEPQQSLPTALLGLFFLVP